MSVFATHVGPRFSVTRVLLASVALTVAFFLARPDSQSTALVSNGAPASSEYSGPEVFSHPVEVQWEGRVTRTLAGGLGLEIRSSEAGGGYFFAYADIGFPPSVSDSPVLVRGSWLGISCEYGRCAPEVRVFSVQMLPIELQ